MAGERKGVAYLSTEFTERTKKEKVPKRKKGLLLEGEIIWRREQS
jgi:hypothetical protein